MQHRIKSIVVALAIIVLGSVYMSVSNPVPAHADCSGAAKSFIFLDSWRPWPA